MVLIDSHIHFPAGCERQPDIGSGLIRNAMRNGIGACVASHIFGVKMGPDLHFPSSEGIRLANGFAAAQCRLNPGRLFFMGYVNPQNPDWQEEMDRSIAEGACGIKLWVSLKDARGSLENTVRVLRGAALRKMPVYLHVFNRTGGNLPGEIDMAEFAELAQTVPDCRMIAGHTGGNWRRSAEIIARCPENAWMETGGSNPDLGMVDGILKFCPPERLLYGSDAPGRAFFPQIWKILESALSEADRERVFCRNAMELLALPEPRPIPETEEIYGPVPGPENIDHCCFCGRYPFEARPEFSPEQLETALKGEGIGEAYTADFGAIFGADISAENRRFLQQCRTLERVRPLAVADPAAPDRDAVLAEISAGSGWAGLWLSPAFHHWRADDPAYTEFLQRCAALGKPVFINCGFYEPRFFRPELSLRPVSDDELISFLKKYPFGRFIVQGKTPPAGAGEFGHCLWCYTQLTDRGGALAAMLKQTDAPKLVRGSEFPFRHLHETLAAARAAVRCG